MAKEKAAKYFASKYENGKYGVTMESVIDGVAYYDHITLRPFKTWEEANASADKWQAKENKAVAKANR